MRGWRGKEGEENIPDRGGTTGIKVLRPTWEAGGADHTRLWVWATCTPRARPRGGKRLECSFRQAQDSPCFPLVSPGRPKR